MQLFISATTHRSWPAKCCVISAPISAIRRRRSASLWRTSGRRQAHAGTPGATTRPRQRRVRDRQLARAEANLAASGQRQAAAGGRLRTHQPKQPLDVDRRDAAQSAGVLAAPPAATWRTSAGGALRNAASSSANPGGRAARGRPVEHAGLRAQQGRVLGQDRRGAGERAPQLRVEARLEQRQQLVAHAVAKQRQVGVARVLAPRQAVAREMLEHPGARDAEQRADQQAAPGAHRAEPDASRAAQQPEQHGLGLVVAGVGYGDRNGALAARYASQEGVALLARGALEALSVATCTAPDVGAAHVQ